MSLAADLVIQLYRSGYIIYDHRKFQDGFGPNPTEGPLSSFDAIEVVKNTIGPALLTPEQGGSREKERLLCHACAQRIYEG